MNHPNIAKVFDAGATEAGRPYFVMELVRGSRSRNTAIKIYSRRWIGSGFLCRFVRRFNTHIRGASSIGTSNLPIYS